MNSHYQEGFGSCCSESHFWSSWYFWPVLYDRSLGTTFLTTLPDRGGAIAIVTVFVYLKMAGYHHHGESKRALKYTLTVHSVSVNRVLYVVGTISGQLAGQDPLGRVWLAKLLQLWNGV